MIIAEIGYNHLGDASIANDYLDVLLETNIDAVTFQIREVSHREQTPEIYLNDEVFVDLEDLGGKVTADCCCLLRIEELLEEVFVDLKVTADRLTLDG